MRRRQGAASCRPGAETGSAKLGDDGKRTEVLDLRVREGRASGFGEDAAKLQSTATVTWVLGDKSFSGGYSETARLE